MLRKVALSTFLLGFALYIFLPTPDELFIYPAAGLFFSYALHISLIDAVLLTTLLYYGSGVVSLAGALLIGGKPVYNIFKAKMRRSKIQPLPKRGRISSS